MRIYFQLYCLLLLVVFWSSCRKDLEFAQSSGNLEFSRDTIFLDTVFTNTGSSTYALKVYNKTRDDVEIPSIRLAQGNTSGYRLNVDGLAGKEFTNVPLLAKDSLFIFIETTFDISSSDSNAFLYTDAIQFDTNENLQEVQLVTLVKDAVFLYPNTLPDGTKETVSLGFGANGEEVRAEGFYLEDEELYFTNERAYVIYGYAIVPEGKELKMDPGTRVYFHNESGLFVSKDASLKTNGTLSTDQELMENEIIFEGDRLEPEFSDVAGQWGSIWLSKGSIDNRMEYLTIRNATIGIFAEGNDLSNSTTLEIKNTQIYNSSLVNLWAKTATIVSENCIFGSAGNSSVYCNLGGDYSFLHATIANHWVSGFRTGPALQIDNSNTKTSVSLEKARFVNCIIDGNSGRELTFAQEGTSDFNYFFSHCLIKFEDTSQDPRYDFEDTSKFEIVHLNEEPDFFDARRNDFRIGEMSFAKGKADSNASLLAPLDLLGKDRTSSPDIGAYQITN